MLQKTTDKELEQIRQNQQRALEHKRIYGISDRKSSVQWLAGEMLIVRLKEVIK